MINFSDYIDPLILPVVEILNKHGFETYESCQGGDGHCYPYPAVRFFGSEYDLIKAYEICQAYGFCLGDAKRIYRKEDVYINQGVGEDNGTPIGEAWGIPTNELEFRVHSKTGTIYRPL